MWNDYMHATEFLLPACMLSDYIAIDYVHLFFFFLIIIGVLTCRNQYLGFCLEILIKGFEQMSWENQIKFDFYKEEAWKRGKGGR